MLWRAPEKKERGEKEDSRPRSSKGVGVDGGTSSGGGVTSVGSATGSNGVAPTSSMATSNTAVSGASYHSHVNGGGVTAFGGAKGAVFLGCVEIALPNFRRGEWVEGWWPVYHHANQMTGAGASGAGGASATTHGPGQAPGNFSGLGMGAAAMGLGGLSGVGGVAGALVQVGEMRLKIKVDE